MMVIWTGVNIFLALIGIILLVVGAVRDNGNIFDSVFVYFAGIIFLIACAISTVGELIKWLWF